jgi:hypothetical protein
MGALRLGLASRIPGFRLASGVVRGGCAAGYGVELLALRLRYRLQGGAPCSRLRLASGLVLGGGAAGTCLEFPSFGRAVLSVRCGRLYAGSGGQHGGSSEGLPGGSCCGGGEGSFWQLREIPCGAPLLGAWVLFAVGALFPSCCCWGPSGPEGLFP